MPSNPYLDRLYSILGLQSRGYETYEELMALDDTSGLYDDVYVVHYDFEQIGMLPNMPRCFLVVD